MPVSNAVAIFHRGKNSIHGNQIPESCRFSSCAIFWIRGVLFTCWKTQSTIYLWHCCYGRMCPEFPTAGFEIHFSNLNKIFK